MNADGSGLIQLTNNTSFESAPAWSPDGSKIAFHSNLGGNMEIYAMNANGSGQTNLTNSPTRGELNPDWSPDGSTISFQGCGGGYDDICVMNPDGSGLTNLTNSPADYEGSPAWSPDGSRIAFSAERQEHYGNIEVYVMNADGSGLMNVSQHPALDAHPTWSPDGSKIAFVSRRDNDNEEIYTMNADGSAQTRLTNTAALEAWPSWQPLAVPEPTPTLSPTATPTQTPTPEPSTTPTSTPIPTNTPAPTLPLPTPGVIDSDGDGCDDGAELGLDQQLGGRRDPQNFWDFIDQWIGGSKDQRITLSDVGAVVARFATGRTPPPTKEEALAEALTPPTDTTSYHASADRSGPDPQGNLWNLFPPDGTITVGDIGAVTAQFGHSCA